MIIIIAKVSSKNLKRFRFSCSPILLASCHSHNFLTCRGRISTYENKHESDFGGVFGGSFADGGNLFSNEQKNRQRSVYALYF